MFGIVSLPFSKAKMGRIRAGRRRCGLPNVFAASSGMFWLETSEYVLMGQVAVVQLPFVCLFLCMAFWLQHAENDRIIAEFEFVMDIIHYRSLSYIIVLYLRISSKEFLCRNSELWIVYTTPLTLPSRFTLICSNITVHIHSFKSTLTSQTHSLNVAITSTSHWRSSH